MNIDPLLHAPLSIKVHLTTVVPAFVIGTWLEPDPHSRSVHAFRCRHCLARCPQTRHSTASERNDRGLRGRDTCRGQLGTAAWEDPACGRVWTLAMVKTPRSCRWHKGSACPSSGAL